MSDRFHEKTGRGATLDGVVQRGCPEEAIRDARDVVSQLARTVNTRRNHPIYSDSDQGNSLPFRLYNDGLGELAFHPGRTPERRTPGSSPSPTSLMRSPRPEPVAKIPSDPTRPCR